METVIVFLIVGISAGWFAHRLYRTATTSDDTCTGGCCCNCGNDPFAEYRKDRRNQKR